MPHRFYISACDCPREANILWLKDGEAAHALRVLRLRTGDEVSVLDGAGQELTCTISSHDRTRAELQVRARHYQPAPPASLTLLSALPKGKLIETIIQKATELNVTRVVPLLTERVIVHLDAGEAVQKGHKWQQVAVEAIKQCGARWLPKVEPPIKLSEFLGRKESFELPLVGSLHPGCRHPREYFQEFQAREQRKPHSLAVFIGPEGDFSADEVAAIEAAGARPITLGPLVLRTDTAALYCLSVLNYEMQA